MDFSFGNVIPILETIGGNQISLENVLKVIGLIIGID